MTFQANTYSFFQIIRRYAYWELRLKKKYNSLSFLRLKNVKTCIIFLHHRFHQVSNSISHSLSHICVTIHQHKLNGIHFIDSDSLVSQLKQRLLLKVLDRRGESLRWMKSMKAGDAVVKVLLWYCENHPSISLYVMQRNAISATVVKLFFIHAVWHISVLLRYEVIFIYMSLVLFKVSDDLISSIKGKTFIRSTFVFFRDPDVVHEPLFAYHCWTSKHFDLSYFYTSCD